MKKIKNFTPIFDHKMLEIENQDLDTIDAIRLKINFASVFYKEAYQHMRAIDFGTTQEEIYFFKHVKPHIIGTLKFLNRKLNYLHDTSWLTGVCREQYLKNKLEKINNFKKDNNDLYYYLKFDSESLDEFYFLRTNNNDLFHHPKEYLDESIIHGSSTYYSNLVTKIYYYRLQGKYFKDELIRFENLKNGIEVKNEDDNLPELEWTETKRALLEMVKSLHKVKAINNGDISLQALIDVFSKLFNIDMKNHYKIFSEIKQRSGEQLTFLEKLKESLQESIDLYDA